MKYRHLSAKVSSKESSANQRENHSVKFSQQGLCTLQSYVWLLAPYAFL